MLYFFLDTETTGFAAGARIVSIGWAVYGRHGGRVFDRYHIIYPDGFQIPAASTAVHGITTATARRVGMPITSVLTQLNTDIAGSNPGLLVGHNVCFDLNTVATEYRLLCAREDLSRLPRFCTMKETARICGFRAPNG